MIALC
jgi:hypothetical protein